MSYWVSREERRRLSANDPVLTNVPEGVSMADLLDRVGNGVETRPPANGKLYPANGTTSGNEVVDRWPIQAGNWRLAGVLALAVDGANSPLTGSYTLNVIRWRDGVETTLASFDLGTLVNQVATEALSTPQDFQAGDILILAADNTGGTLDTSDAGVFIAPRWTKVG